jgi:microcystin-dependent protein
MSDPFLGEIKLCAFNFAPRGWAICNGQLLPINQNQALFSVLGTTYGGDGRTTFQLRDFRGRSPLHFGNGYVLGERGGETAHTLSTNELPAHVHFAMADPSQPTQPSPAGNLWAAQSANGYTPQPASPVLMSSQSVSSVGGSQAHNNLSPFLVLNFVIALSGIYPSQN